MQRFRFSRFDMIVGAVVALLIVLIAISALLLTPAAPASASGAKIAYLGPTAGPFNIWLIDPAQPGVAAQAITNSTNGIFDFSVSADGRYIAYSEQLGELQIAELLVIDLQTKAIQQLTDCAGQDAYCTTPVWRPDGKVIAYQRVNLNTNLGVGPSAPRIWLLDMSREPASTFQLFQNSDILGSEPVWSTDGSKLVFYESTSQSVMVYDFNATTPEEQALTIPAGNGMVGSLSPDGTKLVFPEILPAGETIPARAVLRVADLSSQVITDLTPEEALTDDNVVAWNPNGTELALTRT
ncbi:MAG: PD40 domain-containing protein, partial [Anaerolineae bacterium]|nr:PD40 domain-containing protein [Anaerolineae bacterium]